MLGCIWKDKTQDEDWLETGWRMLVNLTLHAVMDRACFNHLASGPNVDLLSCGCHLNASYPFPCPCQRSVFCMPWQLIDCLGRLFEKYYCPLGCLRDYDVSISTNPTNNRFQINLHLNTFKSITPKTLLL